VFSSGRGPLALAFARDSAATIAAEHHLPHCERVENRESLAREGLRRMPTDYHRRGERPSRVLELHEVRNLFAIRVCQRVHVLRGHESGRPRNRLQSRPLSFLDRDTNRFVDAPTGVSYQFASAIHDKPRPLWRPGGSAMPMVRNADREALSLVRDGPTFVTAERRHGDHRGDKKRQHSDGKQWEPSHCSIVPAGPSSLSASRRPHRTTYRIFVWATRSGIPASSPAARASSCDSNGSGIESIAGLYAAFLGRERRRHRATEERASTSTTCEAGTATCAPRSSCTPTIPHVRVVKSTHG